MSKSSSSRRQLQSASARAGDVAKTQGIPPPFTTASSALEPFLSNLDTSKVYITHIDTLPWRFKRRIFAVPLVLNLTIAALLVWRFVAIYPVYMDLFLQIMGYNTSTAAEVSGNKRTRQLVWIMLKRGFMCLLDFVLVRFVAAWPYGFFFELPGNPVGWRWIVGFEDAEVVVRVSRSWSAEDLTQGQKQGAENPFFKTRILPAVDKHWMHGKTGYMMMGKDFDLDFAAMVGATDLIKQKRLDMNAFQTTVLMYSDGHGWLAWLVHELNQTSETQARDTIVAFKDKLTLMGKESLFFRWIELIQFESSQAEGSIPEKQAKAVGKAKILFQEQGVDFDAFLATMGGLEAMPGLAMNT